MKEFELKYGCNPNQKPARVFMRDGGELPFEILNGRPGYINFLDALNAWQLVKELSQSSGHFAATSFKHVSPTSAAIGIPLSESLKRAVFLTDGDLSSPAAMAYARARGTDRLCSFGDFVALSGTCDTATANLIKNEVSDGIIAPDYEPEALEILKSKRKGSYTVIKIDKDYEPETAEFKDVFGVRFEQRRNDSRIEKDLLKNVVTAKKNLLEEAVRDLLVSLITLKYTQSNSVCFAKDGQAIGVGAGQQSRLHCTRLAGSKADIWHLRQHPKTLELPFRDDIGRPARDNAIDLYLSEYAHQVLCEGEWQKVFKVRPSEFSQEDKREYLNSLTGVSVGSDAFFPFADNIARAAESGAEFVAQPGGSIRDDEVIAECDRRGMMMAFTGLRLFHH